eukprot:m.461044 g.461044  ORF g.461044 m.461044 type:complete len:138 (-) comp57015_c1_seq57:1927-2340(-)
MLDPHSSSSSFSSRAQGSARYPIICLAFLLLFLSCGVEVSYGGYVLTYAVKSDDVHFSKDDAAWLTSVYWGAFALGRMLAIGLAVKMRPGHILLCNALGTGIAAVLLAAIYSSSEFEESRRGSRCQRATIRFLRTFL